MIAQPRLVEPLRDGFEDAGDEGPAFAFGLGQFVGDMLVVWGASSFWSIGELFEQRKRVEKGWFPKRPEKKER